MSIYFCPEEGKEPANWEEESHDALADVLFSSETSGLLESPLSVPLIPYYLRSSHLLFCYCIIYF